MEARQRRFIKKDISDSSVQKRRDRKDPHYHRSIHAYAPLYINPRNPMLYARHQLQESICIVEIDLRILDDRDFLLTDGNAAANKTKFFASLDGFRKLSWDVLKSRNWVDLEDGKRKMCAEALIYPSVPSAYLKRLHFLGSPHHDELQAIKIPKETTPSLFFEVER